MKKRILLLATVVVLMALMLVVMTSAALAVPPAGFSTGCDGGLTNAAHAVTQSSPSWDATSGNEHVSNPAKSRYGPGTQDNAGIETASATGPISDSSNCR
jgi:hypothetical protein